MGIDESQLLKKRACPRWQVKRFQEIRENGEVLIVDSNFQRSAVKADTLVLAEVKTDEMLYWSCPATYL